MPLTNKATLISMQPQKCSAATSSSPKKVDLCCFDFKKKIYDKPKWLNHTQPVPQQAPCWHYDLHTGCLKTSPSSWLKYSQLESEANKVNSSNRSPAGSPRTPPAHRQHRGCRKGLSPEDRVGRGACRQGVGKTLVQSE